VSPGISADLSPDDGRALLRSSRSDDTPTAAAVIGGILASRGRRPPSVCRQSVMTVTARVRRRGKDRTHGWGMRITAIVLGILLAAMTTMYLLTAAKLSDGAAQVDAGAAQASRFSSLRTPVSRACVVAGVVGAPGEPGDDGSSGGSSPRAAGGRRPRDELFCWSSTRD
jgi:hypothetical protein